MDRNDPVCNLAGATLWFIVAIGQFLLLEDYHSESIPFMTVMVAVSVACSVLLATGQIFTAYENYTKHTVESIEVAQWIRFRNS
jgi:hypothetical protein